MTYEEFQAGMAETPEILATVLEKHEADAVKYLTDGKKMVVTTMDEYTKNTQKAVDEATKRNHTDWETKIEKVTGQKRPDGVKGLEWFDTLSTKLRYLTDDGADPNSAMIKGLQKELSDLKTSLSAAEKKEMQARIDGQITSAIKGLAFAVPSHLKKDDDKSAYARQKAEDSTDIFNARYTTTVDEQGRFVFTNKKGEAQTENGQPMTAEAIAARDFANELVPKGHKGAGAGSGNDDIPNPSGNADFLGNTTEDIRKKIAEMGVGVGTDKWSELYTKAHLAAGYVRENDQFVKKS